MLEEQVIVTQAFHEIPSRELDVVEFCKIKDMRFGEYGGGDIQLVANFRQIIEKVRIRQSFGIFIYELFFDMTISHQLCPDPHFSTSVGIIHHYTRFHGKSKLFLKGFSIFRHIETRCGIEYFSLRFYFENRVSTKTDIFLGIF